MSFKGLSHVTAASCVVRGAASLAICTASLGFATETRVKTLGYNSGIEDETQVFTHPGQIGKYKVALIELGTSGNNEAYGAAMTNLGNGIHLGAALSRTDWLFTSSLAGHSSLSSMTSTGSSSAISLFDLYQYAMLDSATPLATRNAKLTAPARPVEFLLGFDIGMGTLGVRLAYADYKSKADQSNTGVSSSAKSTAQQTQLSVGLHSGSFDVSVTVDPTSSQKESENTGGTETSTSLKGSNLGIDARWLGSDTESSPYLSGKLVSRSFKVSGSAAGRSISSKFSDQLIVVEGGYVAMRDATGPKLFTGVQLTQNSSKGPTITGTGASAVPSYTASDESAKLDTTVVTANLGGEATIYGGLGLMAGMNYVVFGDVTQKDNTTNQNIKVTRSFTETSDDTLWALGVFYKAEALRIDASYSKQFLHNGPYLISGAATAPLLGKISASYAF